MLKNIKDCVCGNSEPDLLAGTEADEIYFYVKCERCGKSSSKTGEIREAKEIWNQSAHIR